MGTTGTPSRSEPKGGSYLSEVGRELLIAAIILAVVGPIFYLLMTKYADGLTRRAGDPAFQDSIRKMDVRASKIIGFRLLSDRY